MSTTTFEASLASVRAVDPSGSPRLRVAGKFLYRGSEKFYLRGVTYGTFRPEADGVDFPPMEIVREDFRAMAAAGINAVRTYSTPPLWLLDEAAVQGLLVMVGFPWEQHIAFLDEHERPGEIERRLREAVRCCVGHPAVACYTIGNEIPASIVRWYGRKRIERFLLALARAVKEEDPGALVTYVNYPTTEYLDLPFLDFVAFNVYLESRDRLESYLARLQNLTGDRPLVMAEIGLDSRRNTPQAQAETLDWQIRSIFAAGCAGLFVFSWTDEWYRGGYDITDWDFGLTTRERLPKPALASVRRAFSEVPFARDLDWPGISVVICTYNGSRTIRETLDHVTSLDYPNYEVIVVDDGSTDESASIAASFPVRLVRTPNQGLSAARNTGIRESQGEIVAFIDDDAYPDPHWLRYLAYAYMTTDCAAVGGPNLPPPEDGRIAACVANAPGGPIHVLISDRDAEHIPGCNCSFRKACLQAVGGFDPIFRAAGDDVDVCWKIIDRGWKIFYHPAALVWHHRRNSIRAYWKQQNGYGKAEALLEQKYPARYNPLGHLSWAGRLYGRGVVRSLTLGRNRIYHGIWNSAPFQAMYQRPASLLEGFAQMPEWYLIAAALAVFCMLGIWWRPLLAFTPLLAGSLALPLIQAIVSASGAAFPSVDSRAARVALRALTAALYVVQPIARLRGRIQHGLTLWRRRLKLHSSPLPRTEVLWSELWRSAEDWLRLAEFHMRRFGASCRHGGDFDRFDLSVIAGIFGGARLRFAIEEHGGGQQLLRFRTWPVASFLSILTLITFAVLGVAAYVDDKPIIGWFLGGAALIAGARISYECGDAAGTLRAAIRALEREAAAAVAPPVATSAPASGD